MNPNNCLDCKHSVYFVGHWVRCDKGKNKIGLPYWWWTLTRSQMNFVMNMGCLQFEKAEVKL
jgi:hypothetical protein